jgi:hypothetical protein
MNAKAVICVSLACLGLLGAGIWVSTASRHGVDRDRFERIRMGMTENEVEAVLGGPAGNYAKGDVVVLCRSHRVLAPHPDGIEPKKWTCDEAIIFVYFADDKVVAKEVQDIPTYKEPLFARFRRWVGL